MASWRCKTDLLWWALLALAIALSVRAPAPVIWGDSPPFLESALRTLETRRPVVVGGRDAGYPEFLAANFALGGDLVSSVVVQMGLWLVLIVALAATVRILTGRAYALLPIIVLAMYPGLLIYRNVIAAEMLYAAFLGFAAIALLFGLAAGALTRCVMTCIGLQCAAAAACCKSQGFAVLVVAGVVALLANRSSGILRQVALILACVLAVGIVATASRIGASSSDDASRLFVPKTLFCNHADIILASEPARALIEKAAGANGGRMLARLASDMQLRPEAWPILGFFGDQCLFDPVLDQYLSAGGAQHARKVYLAAFARGILDRPLLYLRKLGRQFYYGAWSSWPAHGLEPSIPYSSDDIPHIAAILRQHGFAASTAELSKPVKTWLLSDLGPISIALFELLSLLFVASAALALVLAWGGQQQQFVIQAGVLLSLWAASTFPSAAVHTLDIKRYLIPATPIVALLLSLTLIELVEMLARQRKIATHVC